MQILVQMFREAEMYKNAPQSKNTVQAVTRLYVCICSCSAASQDISSVMERYIINQPGLNLSVGQVGCSPRLLELRGAPKQW